MPVISADAPLLHGDETTTDGGRGDFGLVDGDDGGGNTDGNARNDTPSDKHGYVLRDQ